MKGVKRLTPSTYETGDFITIVDDDYVFAGNDLDNGRAEEFLGVLSDSDKAKLLMMDKQAINNAVSKLGTFRSLSTRQKNLKKLRRRKYNFDGGARLKANAQTK